MDAKSIIQRLKQNAVKAGLWKTPSSSPSVVLNPLDSFEETMGSFETDPRAPYQITNVTNGPGLGQFQTLLALLPPLNLKNGPWMAGGAVRRILQKASLETGDVDFFFSSAGDYLKFNNALRNFEEVHRSARAYTYLVNGLKVQIIKRKFYKSLEELFGDFDFSVCQLATDGKNIAYAENSVEDVFNQRLRFAKVGRITKMTVVGRLIKYVNHGFVPEAGLFRMIVESGLDITGAHQMFEMERPNSNYDHDAKVEECLDAKVFNSDALREAAIRLGVELPQ